MNGKANVFENKPTIMDYATTPLKTSKAYNNNLIRKIRKPKEERILPEINFSPKTKRASQEDLSAVKSSTRVSRKNSGLEIPKNKGYLMDQKRDSMYAIKLEKKLEVFKSLKKTTKSDLYSSQTQASAFTARKNPALNPLAKHKSFDNKGRIVPRKVARGDRLGQKLMKKLNLGNYPSSKKSQKMRKSGSIGLRTQLEASSQLKNKHFSTSRVRYKTHGSDFWMNESAINSTARTSKIRKKTQNHPKNHFVKKIERTGSQSLQGGVLKKVVGGGAGGVTAEEFNQVEYLDRWLYHNSNYTKKDLLNTNKVTLNLIESEKLEMLKMPELNLDVLNISCARKRLREPNFKTYIKKQKTGASEVNGGCGGVPGGLDGGGDAEGGRKTIKKVKKKQKLIETLLNLKSRAGSSWDRFKGLKSFNPLLMNSLNLEIGFNNLEKQEMKKEILNKLLIEKLERENKLHKITPENKVKISSQVLGMAHDMISHFKSLRSLINSDFRFDFEEFIEEYENRRRLVEKLKKMNEERDGAEKHHQAWRGEQNFWLEQEDLQRIDHERQQAEENGKESLYYEMFFETLKEIGIKCFDADKARKNVIGMNDWIKRQFWNVSVILMCL